MNVSDIDDVHLDGSDESLSMKRSTNSSNGREFVTKKNSGIDQAILDEIGVESSDSEDADDDNLQYSPAPSIFSQNRNSFMNRSQSMVCFGTIVQDDFHLKERFCDKDPLMPSPKRFTTGIEPQPSIPSLGGGLRRSTSMSRFQTSRSDYNRSVGEALTTSPKKGAMNPSDDMAIMEQLLSEL